MQRVDFWPYLNIYRNHDQMPVKNLFDVIFEFDNEICEIVNFCD